MQPKEENISNNMDGNTEPFSFSYDLESKSWTHMHAFSSALKSPHVGMCRFCLKTLWGREVSFPAFGALVEEERIEMSSAYTFA